MIGIHPLHRKLAEVVHVCTDKNGNTLLGIPEMQQIIPLLRQNLALVQQLDELKNLAYQAHVIGDLAWEQEICAKIDALEATLI